MARKADIQYILLEKDGIDLLGSRQKLTKAFVVIFKYVAENDDALSIVLFEVICQHQGFFIQLGEHVNVCVSLDRKTNARAEIFEKRQKETKGKQRCRNDQHAHPSRGKRLQTGQHALHILRKKRKVTVYDKDTDCLTNGKENGVDSPTRCTIVIIGKRKCKEHNRGRHKHRSRHDEKAECIIILLVFLSKQTNSPYNACDQNRDRRKKANIPGHFNLHFKKLQS